MKRIRAPIPFFFHLLLFPLFAPFRFASAFAPSSSSVPFLPSLRFLLDGRTNTDLLHTDGNGSPPSRRSCLARLRRIRGIPCDSDVAAAARGRSSAAIRAGRRSAVHAYVSHSAREGMHRESKNTQKNSVNERDTTHNQSFRCCKFQ